MNTQTLKHHVRNFAVTAFAPAALTLVACASTHDGVIAGKIGCAANEIEILEHEPDIFNLHNETWVARCDGRKYYCSSPPGQHLDGVTCTQAFRYSRDAR